MITEQDLIELGFEREISQEGYSEWLQVNIGGQQEDKEEVAFYNLLVDEIEFSSNTDDEWDDELWVEIADTSIVFRNLEDLRQVIDILKRNQE